MCGVRTTVRQDDDAACGRHGYALQLGAPVGAAAAQDDAAQVLAESSRDQILAHGLGLARGEHRHHAAGCRLWSVDVHVDEGNEAVGRWRRSDAP